MADLKNSITSDVLGSVLKNPEIQQSLIAALLGLIGGLFKRKKETPTVPVTVPTPNPNSADDDFPDDIIPAPPTKKKVVSVHGKIARVQLSAQRFPDRRQANGQGYVYSDAELKAVQAGGAVPFDSKVWLDATAFDDKNVEFLRDRVLSHGLAYKTEHHAGSTFIKGKGADAQGQPVAGYETNDTDEIGNGISAWISSLGFLHQIKVRGEGQYDCYVVVDGVESNHFPLNVS